MRLEHLCDFILEYDEDGLTIVRPFGGSEGQGFGTGLGRAEGERLSGPLRWANFPRMTDDGRLMPRVTGSIATAAGPVLFEFRGYSRLPASGSQRRSVTAAIDFRTEAEEHRWLNDTVAVHGGYIDFATMTTRFPAYACLDDA